VQFLVIVNPDSGPGVNTLSDPNFIREIPRLNSYSNVVTIGYVLTEWATRDITDVFDDVDTYASFATTPNPNNDGTFGLNGIFFDQAPNGYTTAAVQFMQTIDAYVKGHSGFGHLSFVKSLIKML
jgi:Spherulation-specific family 4